MTKDKKEEGTVTVDVSNIDPDILSGAYMGFEGSFGVGGNDSNLEAITISTDTTTFSDGQATLTLTMPRDGDVDLHGGYTTAPISTYSTDVITVTNDDLKESKSFLVEEMTSENYLEGQQLDLFDDRNKKS